MLRPSIPSAHARPGRSSIRRPLVTQAGAAGRAWLNECVCVFGVMRVAQYTPRVCIVKTLITRSTPVIRLKHNAGSGSRETGSRRPHTGRRDIEPTCRRRCGPRAPFPHVSEPTTTKRSRCLIRTAITSCDKRSPKRTPASKPSATMSTSLSVATTSRCNPGFCRNRGPMTSCKTNVPMDPGHIEPQSIER
jgi:hypothetical protein